MKFSRELAFLAVMLLYCPWGQYSQLFKAGMLALFCACFVDRSIRRFTTIEGKNLGERAVIAMLAIVALGWVSSAISPIVPLVASLWGEKWRSDGMFPVTAAVLFGLFAYWRHDPLDSKELFNPSAHRRFGWALAAFTWAGLAIWSLAGKDWLTTTVGTELGISMYLALAIPYLFAWLWCHPCNKKESLFLSITILAAFAGIAATGFRCSLFGSVAGIVVVVILNATNKTFTINEREGFGRKLLYFILPSAVACFLLIPRAYQKLAAINLSAIGQGVRSELAAQAWNCGMFPLGWGWNCQRFLIQHTPEMEVGNFDRFHCYPIDLAMSLGWAGVAAIAVLGWFLVALARQNAAEWGQKGAAGIVAAFVVSTLWNPPTIQSLAIVSIAIGSLTMLWHGWREEPLQLRKLPLRPLAWVVAAALGVMVAGDWINTYAIRLIRDNRGYPHVAAGLQTLSVRLNPWTWEDRVRAYWALHARQRMVEPPGGKKMLLDLLDLAPQRHYWLEAIMWTGLGEKDAAERAFEKEKTEKLKLFRQIN